MTIECYYHRCRFHGKWAGEEGPYCFQQDCKATDQELETLAKGRRLERMGYDLDELERDNPYNGGLNEPKP